MFIAGFGFGGGLCECLTSGVLVYLLCFVFVGCIGGVLPGDGLVVFIVVFVCMRNSLLCHVFDKCLAFFMS